MKLTPLELSRITPQALPEVTNLDLKNKDISHIDDISCCVQLRKLDLTGNRLHHADSLSGLAYCSSLRWIKVEGNGLDSIDFISRFDQLDVLNCSRNKISAIPPSVAKCTKLKALILNNNAIRHIENVFNLADLNTIVLSHNLIKDIPSLSSLLQLQKLSLAHNKLHTLPKIDLPELKELRLNDNKIATIPRGHLPPGLRVLDLGNNVLSSWEDVDAIKPIPFLTNLNLKGNAIASNDTYKETLMTWYKDLRVLDGARVDDAFIARKEKRKRIAEFLDNKDEGDTVFPWQRPYGGTKKALKYNVKKGEEETIQIDEETLARNQIPRRSEKKPRLEEDGTERKSKTHHKDGTERKSKTRSKDGNEKKPKSHRKDGGERKPLDRKARRDEGVERKPIAKKEGKVEPVEKREKIPASTTPEASPASPEEAKPAAPRVKKILPLKPLRKGMAMFADSALSKMRKSRPE